MALISEQPDMPEFDEESGVESCTSSSDGEGESRMVWSMRSVAVAIASSLFVVGTVMTCVGGFSSLSTTANTEKEHLFHVFGQKGSSTPWWSFAAVGGLVSAKLIGGSFSCLGHCGTLLCNGIGAATGNCWSALGGCGTAICTYVGNSYSCCFGWIGGCFGHACWSVTTCLGKCPVCGDCLFSLSEAILHCFGAIYWGIGNVIGAIYYGIFNVTSTICGLLGGCVNTIYTGLGNCCANIWGGLDRCCASCCPILY